MASVKQSIVRHVQSSLGRDEYSATKRDRYHALCLSVRDALIERWVNTQQTYYHSNARRVYYLSLEFLMGRALRNALVNLDMLEVYESALVEMGTSLAEMEELGVDAGLGNGGLGRLAACFLDSMATLQLPGYGYGLRYDYGIFRQDIRDGRQVEEPDDWLRLPNPWEIPRPDYDVRVKFGGRLQVYADHNGRLRHRWVDTEDVLATPFDTPIPGYNNNTVNTLRLWRARGTAEFDLGDFNVGDYVGAVEHKVLAENITKVLYPNDNVYSGKELRLRQQYFLVSATLQDVIRRHLVKHDNLDTFADKNVFQLNDTHPALAIAEMMRLLVDENGYAWEKAWDITTNCMAYTNHTLLPEALERWNVDMLGRLLPRHVDIVNEINARFLKTVQERFPNDAGMLGRVSIYEEGDAKRMRMAHLAVIGSFSVNGVAALHTDLLKSRVLPDFYKIWPDKFNNKTNGVTQRRWLKSCNSPLAELITSKIGDGWITDLTELQKLTQYVEDDGFLEQLAGVKRAAKLRLAEHVKRRFDFTLDPDAVFDVQIKRIHEYKRQLLNIFHVIHCYLQLKRDPSYFKNPRAFLFGGKAAPGYAMAKLVIRLINAVGRAVNSDASVSHKLRVFFYPNYNVSGGELLFPAADISEQISTAGFEASGTGNMKFALNGALTIGTLDGANVEIAQEVGDDNIIIFGKTVEEVEELRHNGYNPRDYYYADQNIREVIDLLSGEFFNLDEPGVFGPIVDTLMNGDFYLVLADFEGYRKAHLEADAIYSDRRRWGQITLMNIAKVGTFSSDRTISDYVRDIWKVERFPVLVNQ
ncbi:MAG: glycogen/starch/alpha-glucan phosphorylase [Myxococcales bacterium]|nr:glycogen/starch/alpha-glucan phosphorylase [Myxococcales bacterium]